MNSVSDHCNCEKDGISPNCPNLFNQNGEVFHVVEMDKELKNEPRLFRIKDGGSTTRPLVNSDNAVDDGGEGGINQDFAGSSAFQEVESAFPKHLSVSQVPLRQSQKSKLVNANTLLDNNREVLRKFEALNVNGRALTDISIGGYEVDLTQAAQKARAVMPLPPAKLPRIYADADMNFLHHFFQGLDRLAGRERILSIVNQDRYYTTDEPILLPLIEDLISVGYERKDTSLTVFTKSVLSSTFDPDEKSRADAEDRGLIVAANLWGFQYIESGMECKEVDLKMWLSINYSHFRNMHFNTFKDSGMPAFVLEGVQSRYESMTKPVGCPSLSIDRLEEFNDKSGTMHRSRPRRSRDERSTASYTSRRSKRPEQSLGGILFGGKHH